MNVFKKVAKQHNTTPAEVRKEIALAIYESYHKLDPEAQKAWNRLIPDGKQPTPKKLIDVLTERIILGFDD